MNIKFFGNIFWLSFRQNIFDGIMPGWDFIGKEYSNIFLKGATLFFPMFPFDPTENMRKLLVFWCFKEDQEGTLGRKGLIFFTVLRFVGDTDSLWLEMFLAQLHLSMLVF